MQKQPESDFPLAQEVIVLSQKSQTVTSHGINDLPLFSEWNLATAAHL